MYQFSKSSNPHTEILYIKDGKKKKMKLPTPLLKPKQNLSKRQKELMLIHKEHHTKDHLNLMKKLMKRGFCFEQSHEITMKIIGK
jgi:hypothetical protein